MKKTFVFLAMVLVSACSPHAEPEAAHVTTVDLGSAEDSIDDGIQILDVRTEEEWREGHLAMAVRVDVNQDGFSEKTRALLDPSKPVLVYCRSGSRSAKAAALLEELGFTEIHNLKGGITAWSEAGKPIVRE